MKIGLDIHPAAPAGSYTRHLGKVLAKYAPQHEYVTDGKFSASLDVYHGFRPVLPGLVLRRRVPTVVTVSNLNFLRHPGDYTLSERLFRLASYRRCCRSASRLIALNLAAREELARKLAIDRTRIEVVMPLAATVPSAAPGDGACASVRRKYGLPERFVLMLGTVEPRHNHRTVFDALPDLRSDVGLVVCGRRTAWSDYLLRYARGRHLATRIDFLYEPAPEDLPALFGMARAFVYLPDAELEASIVPVVEAMRVGVPMVLSDVPLNREAAGDAAIYVRPQVPAEVEAALANALEDEDFRRMLAERERRRAALFSEMAVARRLIDIYTSL